MRTLCLKREERKSERERERAPARKNSIIRRVVNLKKGRHTKSQIFWFWTLKRERSQQKQSLIRTVYFPDRMTTCKRLLMPSCVFFDDSFDILKSGLFDACVCVCNKLAFLSSDAANFLDYDEISPTHVKDFCFVLYLGFYSNPKLKTESRQICKRARTRQRK